MKLDTRVIVSRGQSRISCEAWAALDECRDHYGAILPSNLGRYGFTDDVARELYELHLQVSNHSLGRAERSFWSISPWWQRKPESYAALSIL